jgi:hypothetical protein
MNKKGMGMFTLMFLLFMLVIGIAVLSIKKRKEEV